MSRSLRSAFADPSPRRRRIQCRDTWSERGPYAPRKRFSASIARLLPVEQLPARRASEILELETYASCHQLPGLEFGICMVEQVLGNGLVFHPGGKTPHSGFEGYGGPEPRDGLQPR